MLSLGICASFGQPHAAVPPLRKTGRAMKTDSVAVAAASVAIVGLLLYIAWKQNALEREMTLLRAGVAAAREDSESEAEEEATEYEASRMPVSTLLSGVASVLGSLRGAGPPLAEAEDASGSEEEEEEGEVLPSE